jgi:hypothetical protein
MAPHWKCGSGQPVAGSNPALSATTHAAIAAARCVVRSATSLTDVRVPSLGMLPAALRSTTLATRWRSRALPGQQAIHRALLSFRSRARRGTSGALNLQSAIAGLNSLPRSPSPNAARRRDVEDRVPRSGEPRTVSGPEGSSTKRSSSGAAERPGPSRSSWWARERPGRRRVHGISNPRVRRERRRS